VLSSIKVRNPTDEPPEPPPLQRKGTWVGMMGNHKVHAEPDRDIQFYVDDNSRWKTAPPWTKADLDALSESLFGGKPLLLDEFSLRGLATMFYRGNEWFVPKWIKILLDLVRYKHPLLKEVAINFLIASFSQNTNFISSIKDCQLIWMPQIVNKYFEVRRDLFKVRSGVLLLVSADEASCQENYDRDGKDIQGLVAAVHPSGRQQQSAGL